MLAVRIHHPVQWNVKRSFWDKMSHKSIPRTYDLFLPRSHEDLLNILNRNAAEFRDDYGTKNKIGDTLLLYTVEIYGTLNGVDYFASRDIKTPEQYQRFIERVIDRYSEETAQNRCRI